MEALQEPYRIAVYARRGAPGISSVGHAYVQLWGPGFEPLRVGSYPSPPQGGSLWNSFGSAAVPGNVQHETYQSGFDTQIAFIDVSREQFLQIHSRVLADAGPVGGTGNGSPYNLLAGLHCIAYAESVFGMSGVSLYDYAPFNAYAAFGQSLNPVETAAGLIFLQRHRYHYINRPDADGSPPGVLERLRRERAFADEVRYARCFLAGTPILMADGSETPIERIRIGDLVMAFDPAAAQGRGALAPRRVTRTFRNTARTILDLRGLRMTPGHVCLTDGGAFETIAGILRRDGTLVGRDGTRIRARTGAAAGSPEDLPVTVLYADPATGRHRSAIVRAGIPLPSHATLLDALAARGIAPHPDGVLSGPAGARLETCDWPPGHAPLDTPEQRNWVMRSDGHAHVPDWIESLLIEAAEEHARMPTPAHPLPTGHTPIGAALHPHALLGAAIAGNA